MTRLVVRALAVAQPYLRNPLRIPPRIGAAATLFVLSFWFLFGAVTSLLRLLLKPADFAVNLCLGSALHYAALVALRGVGRQLQLMASTERLPFTMATATSFLAAAYVGLRGERLGSLMHLAAFGRESVPRPRLSRRGSGEPGSGGESGGRLGRVGAPPPLKRTGFWGALGLDEPALGPAQLQAARRAALSRLHHPAALLLSRDAEARESS
ncbi:hypothetical protein EMIHUDRAFT_216051 [Emiliania huxleyi CCMP1516]|uniref:Vesicle transport protein n=2 Tax=Emiliania huxleyi TaxID=2903 RepID=A0A0D3IFC0_EMIH1|nr:hypothetical protein EMIHUDRAFT_216051 [Emiliania huxleyi CCMP1516]EOD09955.1 hypothetical protein EMIHUDRAFT_216051 [Emiliania huxleyi CCMP1516]|eukprot:XP_005762384.1 hypothetical protein EMIHUDRAFT_216051 [Emiliania huxleyi CCMP1516]